MIQFALLVMVLGFVALVAALCTEGLAWWQYLGFQGQTAAQVVDEMEASFAVSRGTVEVQMEDGSFRPVEPTTDRSVGHMPFYHWLFERGKYQYVLQWQAEGKLWQGHYRFLKKKGEWQVGDSIALGYRTGKPWVYGVKDEKLWRVFLGKCLLDVTVIFAGVILLICAAG